MAASVEQQPLSGVVTPGCRSNTFDVTSPKGPPGGGVANFNLNDYGLIFLEAAGYAGSAASGCADDAAAGLANKIHNYLQMYGCDASGGATTGDHCQLFLDGNLRKNVGPYQAWLDGANAQLIFASALVLGGQGKLTEELDNYLIGVEKNFAYNKEFDCSQSYLPTGDSCMDDHTVGASGYAWMAAYEYKRGRYGTAYSNGVYGALQHLSASLSTAESVCINAGWPYGDGCNGSPADLGPGGNGQVYSLNHGLKNNIPYGFGLMTSFASALVGLEEAGNRYYPSADEINVALGLMVEAQQHTFCGAGADFRSDCALVGPSLFTVGSRFCGDGVGDPPDPNRLPHANMFGLYNMYSIYFGIPDTRCNENWWQPAYQFMDDNFAYSSDLSAFFGPGRQAVYQQLGGRWINSYNRKKLSGLINANPPRGFLDGIDASGCATGWGCDPDAPFTSIQVEVKVDGTWTFTTIANLGSEAAVNQHCGGGYAHRFRVCLPAWTAGHLITAWGDDTTAGQAQLPGWLCGATAPACVWTAVNNYQPIGYFDGIDAAGCATGWTCDPDQPNTSIQVQFVAQGRVIAQAPANQGSEPAVNQACGGGVAHRFRACLPASYAGIPITAAGVDTIAGSTTLTPSRPCGATPPACAWTPVNNFLPTGFLDGINASGCAWGWACDPDQPLASIRVDFYNNASGVYLGSATANQGSEDAVNQRCGGGFAHRYSFCFDATTRGAPIIAYGIDTAGGRSLLPGWQCAQNPACSW
ncbi:MAG: hypothetical protein ACM3PC_09390 [Deltaproteobacteria bacterium]